MPELDMCQEYPGARLCRCSAGVFCIGFGLAMVALVIFGDRSVKNAKHTGVTGLPRR